MTLSPTDINLDKMVEFVRGLDGHGLTVDADDQDLREYLAQTLPPFTGDKLTEYPITFHVNASSPEQAEQYRQRMKQVLDEHQDRIMDDLNDDSGAYCSGHLGPPKEQPVSLSIIPGDVRRARRLLG